MQPQAFLSLLIAKKKKLPLCFCNSLKKRDLFAEGGKCRRWRRAGVGLLGQAVGARLRPAAPAHSTLGFIDKYELLRHRVFIEEKQQHSELQNKELVSADSFYSTHSLE